MRGKKAKEFRRLIGKGRTTYELKDNGQIVLNSACPRYHYQALKQAYKEKDG